MNIENLQKMADYVKTILPVNFTMWIYRNGQMKTTECNTIGCIIGHCTVLDDPQNLPKDYEGDIKFGLWSEKFTGLKWETKEWNWCFSSEWSKADNTPEGASKRIEYFLKNGVPKNWQKQIKKLAPLSYN